LWGGVCGNHFFEDAFIFAEAADENFCVEFVLVSVSNEEKLDREGEKEEKRITAETAEDEDRKKVVYEEKKSAIDYPHIVYITHEMKKTKS
jgi:hypothetical protein